MGRLVDSGTRFVVHMVWKKGELADFSEKKGVMAFAVV